jgi:hypothetical protein
MSAPIVPGRNDAPSGIDVYSTSKAQTLAGRNPDFEYQWVSKNPDHPNHVGNYTQARELGNQLTGYVMQDPWEVVTRGEGVEQGRKRADDGKGVDTTVTHGSLILIRTPKANAEKARFIQDRYVDKQADARSAGERTTALNGNVRLGARVFSGDGDSGAMSAPVVSAQLTGGK